MAGRKSKFEELQIVHRYAELAEPFFKAIKGFLDSEDKNDRKFALEQLSKAFPKMIPQQITGEDGQPIRIENITGMNILNEQVSE